MFFICIISLAVKECQGRKSIVSHLNGKYAVVSIWVGNNTTGCIPATVPMWLLLKKFKAISAHLVGLLRGKWQRVVWEVCTGVNGGGGGGGRGGGGVWKGDRIRQRGSWAGSCVIIFPPSACRERTRDGNCSRSMSVKKEKCIISSLKLHFRLPRVQSSFYEYTLYFIFLHLVNFSIWERYFLVHWVITVLSCFFLCVFVFIFFLNEQTFRHFCFVSFWS